ncbi:MAG: hypothetical protein LIQ30_08905 [Planctomycetes bacterium]|nr:hypothetical protein [Planctomycetota bacterium]MCD7895161.1 hypothetical protein [Planctomycetaceae bacterium]
MATDDDALEAYENLCTRCGVCCHQKVRFGDVVVITDVPCEFLDTETNLCTVYPDRFAKQPLCSSAATSVTLQSLPADCPYVRNVVGYRAPVRLEDHPEYEDAINSLFPERLARPDTPARARDKARRARYGRGKK